MTDAYSYETFLRNIWSLHRGREVGRHGDPAQLADTDSFSERNIAAVKAAIAYAMESVRVKVVNEVVINSDAEHRRLESFVPRVIGAASLSDLTDLMNEFSETVIDRYCVMQQGIMRLK